MSLCDNCIYYVYDEDEEYYVCTINLDEDEMYKFIQGTVRNCSYYRDGDDYKLVRHQN